MERFGVLGRQGLEHFGTLPVNFCNPTRPSPNTFLWGSRTRPTHPSSLPSSISFPKCAFGTVDVGICGASQLLPATAQTLWCGFRHSMDLHMALHQCTSEPPEPLCKFCHGGLDVFDQLPAPALRVLGCRGSCLSLCASWSWALGTCWASLGGPVFA